jgi:cellulose synthase/poly-beta-1,6-N-acetylglucosamine synthase-like glycosyltransferase
MAHTLGYIFIVVGIFGLIYIYFLYNIILKLWVKVAKKEVAKDENYQPEITIIISAHNEEALIEKSVLSIFQGDYPLNKIKVIIGSDGSTDKTVQLCEKIAESINLKANSEDKKIMEVYNFPRAGKNKTLNKITPLVKTDIIFFMDADIILDKSTISMMVQNFADPNVGAVISPMVYVEEASEINAGYNGEKMYQSFETKTKTYESQIWSTLNTLGAFYSVRRDLYKLLPNDKVCDDLMPIFNVNIAGKRVIYETSVCVYEIRKKSLSNELARRIRVSSGSMETIWAAKELFSFKQFRNFFFLFSHKIIRYFSPIFLLLIFVGTLLIWKSGVIAYLLILFETVFLLLSFVGYLFEEDKIKFFPAQFSVYFLTMNVGFVLAFIQFLKRSSNSKW